MSNATVLVIDDEAQIRKLLSIILQSHDFNVVEASTAKEGLAIVVSHPPDMIILDLGLPDRSGHEVLSHLREWYINPIIILSVQSSEEDIVKALDHGANDYLVKPFRTGELMARIRSAIRKANPEESNSRIDFQDFEIDFA